MVHIVCSILFPIIQTDLIDENIYREDYYLANEILKTISKKTHYNNYQALLVAYKLNDKKESIYALKCVDNSFISFPRRYEALIFLIRLDIITWKYGDLSDISRDMNKSAKRLENVKVDRVTKDVQQEILDKLDKLIKEKEDNANSKVNMDANTKKIQGQATPQSDSAIERDNGKGQVDEVKLKNLQENWVRLSDHERARAIQELTKELPTRYKILIEDYFKQLNKK